MLANFFNNSKPVNFIIIIGMFFCYLVFASFQQFTPSSSLVPFLANRGLVFLLFLLLFFFFNFITSKNNLTFDNSYALLFFIILLGLFPSIIITSKVFYINLTIVLFLRKVYSLQSSKVIVQKLFDGGFWLGISFLITPFSIVFAFLLYASLYIHKGITIRYLLTPLLGFFTPLFLYFTYLFWYDNTIAFYELFYWFTFYDFSIYMQLKYLLPLLLTGSLAVLFILQKTPKVLAIKNSFRKNWILIIIHFLIALTLLIITKNKNGEEVIYVLFPAAIILANGIELIEKKWLKESVILLFLGSSIVVYFL